MRVSFSQEPPQSIPLLITPNVSNYGSFQDSLKSPVHRWFAYPAGYSHRLVKAKIAQHGLSTRGWIADPFLGSGTTSIVAKMEGVNSLGVEAHPFVYWVTLVKMRFDYDLNSLLKDCRNVLSTARSLRETNHDYAWPALVYKCFSEENLKRLYSLKRSILQAQIEPNHTDFLKLALTATLRIVTTAGSGWPYIAPSKYARRKVDRNAYDEFEKRFLLMLSDLQYIKSLRLPPSEHKIISGDARQLSLYTAPESIDLIVTSPPYLNNYDYGDRTRLETYFWGIYNTWGDITREVRDHLIVAATTQIRLGDMDGIREFPIIRNLAPDVHEELRSVVRKLTEIRQVKPGKKTYDFMVAGYFEDMAKVLKEVFIILKPKSHFVLVLGDSAPYGFHISTEEIIGRLALAVGFKSFSLELLRKRGEKWAHNTQRHKIPLRESVLTIRK